MTWICKKCGQIQPDSIIYSDEICEDCFEKLKNKKKKKGSAFNKILSLALVLSFMLCIFSGFGVASAEGVSDLLTEVVSDGTYMGYDVIEFDKEEVLSGASLKALYDKHFGSIGGKCNLFVYLMEFDDTGKPLFYSANSSGTFLTINPASTTSYRCALSGQPTVIPLENIGTEYKYIHYKYTDKNTFAFLYCKSNSTSVYGAEYAISYTNGEKGFSGFVSDTRYLVFVPFNSTEENDATIFSNFVNGTKDDDFQLSYTSPDYSAKFHSFASANDNVGGVQEILNMIDWIGLGNQYPTVDFSINDAGNNHSYSLRISSNKNYVDVCMALWEDYRLKRLVETSSSAIALAFTPDIISKFVIASSNGNIDGFGIRNNVDNITDAVLFAAQVKFLQSIGDLSYVTEYNLTSPYLQFNEGESPSRAYSVCLPDYVTITKGLVYRLDIVDNYTGMILDTAYFCNDTTFQKTNTGYGTKVYNYSDYDDLLGDVYGDNGYVNNDSYTQGDSLQNDNLNDIVDWDKYNQYDFSNMQNLTGTLNSATAGLGNFFMACFNVIPPVFISILMGTFTLVIILRVLGR